MKTLLSIIVGIALLTSCDVIDNPIETPEIPVDTTKSFKQNVLIEDYTGHTCGNCPEAAEVAHTVQNLYGKDRVVVVAVHSGPFAYPMPPDYATDFQTQEGNALDQTFRISRAGNPNGLVNRKVYNGKFIQSKDNWAAATTEYLSVKPAVGMTATSSWDEASKTVSVNLDLTYITTSTPDYYLATWITESGLVGDQTDYRKSPSHIEDYEFDHVLRSSVGGAWGEQLSTTAVAAGTKVSKTLTYTFPSDKDWKPENCEVVLFVHRHQTEKDVLQVISVPVKSK